MIIYLSSSFIAFLLLQSSPICFHGSGSISPGVASFGTAACIVRNLRMPTLANTSWTAVMKDDGRPIPGESYDEFVITMTADRGELTGMGAVGQSLTSVTRHVFFVRSSIANTFKTDLESALGITVA